MPRAKSTVATVSDPTVNIVLVKDGVLVYRAAYVVSLLAKEGATFRTVAEELGLAPSALHRFVTQCGYKRSPSGARFVRT